MKDIIYEIDSYVMFGRNRGSKIKDILNENPGYIDWAIRNVESFALSENAMKYALKITGGRKYSMDEAELEKIASGLTNNLELYERSFDFTSKELIDINTKKVNEIRAELNNKFSRTRRFLDDTDWSHYNNDRDMDQQSEDFWNQF